MSLENLVKTGNLKPHETSAEEITRLLRAARRNLDDADLTGLSDETRFDLGYKAIMQCAMAGMLASGYRPSTSTPGHHQTVIQTLSLTMGVPRETWLVLDALRKKRNLTDYLGDLADPESVAECLAQASALFRHTSDWLASRRPELVVGWSDCVPNK